MISNPNLLFYTCIAKGTMILAEFSSKDEPGIEALALRCIENVPPHHSMISQTIRKRTYAFINDGLFSYFTILDEVVEKSESLWLFNRLKSATEALVTDGNESVLLDNLTEHCFQSKLDPMFAEIVASGGNKDLNFVESSRSTGGKRSLMPYMGNPLRVLKNKKRLQSEKKMNLGSNKGVRNGLIHDHHHRQKAKQIWEKHVWVVLMFDICICVVLFGIWLWVCQGFQCMSS